MVVNCIETVVNCIETEEESHPSPPRSLHFTMRSLGENLNSRKSPGSREHIVIVMDGLKEFTMKPLQWALNNIAIKSCCNITLLGVMPWLNIPLSSKTWLDIWALELEDLSNVKEKSESKSDLKYVKLQAIVDLCGKYGVVPHMKVAMGYPLPLLAAEQISSLHATWVVFDRHQRKLKRFCAKKIPCNMVRMTDNGNGEVDLIKGRSMIDSCANTPAESPASVFPTPEVVFSEQLKEFLERAQD